ncbi:MAG: nucleotidyl transferase AbiEii/AbiGii toxin family protein [Saprospiraceae bacterium]|nr:nucleotidyl transferase AbiEii/AbiGii toxin family protein [Saprospiraceae bacterium]
MLQTATIHPTTLGILKKIMESSDLKQFNLVGGTALALQIGHRISIDLDLFTFNDYDSTSVIRIMESIGHLEIIMDKPPFLQLRIDDLKIDFLKFPYAFVQDYVELDSVRLVSIENIAIMKLLAVARRGVKKDFFDLYFLLQQYSLEDILKFFTLKIPNVDLFHIIKSLTYFDDAESDANPKMIKKATWGQVKKKIVKETQAYLISRPNIS